MIFKSARVCFVLRRAATTSSSKAENRSTAHQTTDKENNINAANANREYHQFNTGFPEPAYDIM